MILDYPSACLKVTILHKHFCLLHNLHIFCVWRIYTEWNFWNWSSRSTSAGNRDTAAGCEIKTWGPEKVLTFAEDMLVWKKKKSNSRVFTIPVRVNFYQILNFSQDRNTLVPVPAESSLWVNSKLLFSATQTFAAIHPELRPKVPAVYRRILQHAFITWRSGAQFF